MRIRGTAERSHKLKRLEGIRIDIEGRNFPLAISAGWAELLRGERARELLARADAELYASKRAKYAAQSQPVPAKRPPRREISGRSPENQTRKDRSGPFVACSGT
jgi:hypothetical protein